ncbi:hypothetical protein ASD58_27980 [Duganella sp. Root1480D1]|nr:hypothetical protein ASD58_27980 [Duganella sp. Root1480D1]
MRRLLLAVLISCSAAVHAAAPVSNIAGDFASTWDATRELPMAERVAAFRKNVAAKYPDFYSAKRLKVSEEVYDRHIAKFIERFEAIRTPYLDKVRAFDNELPRNLATFSKTFPEFRLNTPTWLVHSLGEMDGGTREFNSRVDLIFGADMMAILHANDDLAPLFHHELFHVYHHQHFACDKGEVWESLWEEGLATYVSHAMNPGASDSELMLDFPQGMRAATEANLAASWIQLGQVLDKSDTALYLELFSTKTGNSALPARRGYYLGYLVAREAAKTRDLASLAKMGCKETRTLIESTVRKLSKEGMQ